MAISTCGLSDGIGYRNIRGHVREAAVVRWAAASMSLLLWLCAKKFLFFKALDG